MISTADSGCISYWSMNSLENLHVRHSEGGRKRKELLVFLVRAMLANSM